MIYTHNWQTVSDLHIHWVNTVESKYMFISSMCLAGGKVPVETDRFPIASMSAAYGAPISNQTSSSIYKPTQCRSHLSRDLWGYPPYIKHITLESLAILIHTSTCQNPTRHHFHKSGFNAPVFCSYITLKL